MLRLKTPWAMYILSNAVRVDIFKTKNKTVWEVYLCIDGYKHLLQSFDNERDSLVFTWQVRDRVNDMLSVNPKDFDQEWDISEVCKAALQEVEEQGMVE